MTDMIHGQGTVDKLYRNQKPDVNKGNPYWAVIVDRKRYTIWEPKLMEGVAQGAVIDFEFDEQGDFKTIRGLKVLSQGQAPKNGKGKPAARKQASGGSAPPSENGPPGPEPPPVEYDYGSNQDPRGNSKDTLIVRQTCIKAACALHANMNGTAAHKVFAALHAAETFERWINGMEMEKVKALLFSVKPE